MGCPASMARWRRPRLARSALDAGVTFLDTADAYGLDGVAASTDPSLRRLGTDRIDPWTCIFPIRRADRGRRRRVGRAGCRRQGPPPDCREQIDIESTFAADTALGATFR
jgi:aryl-alcohol dehydrogenase-like predicted oxidoreductase